MNLLHKVPFQEKQCILSKQQTCRFAEKPEKNEKTVFIAAPSEHQNLVDYVKDILKDDFSLEPIIATDIRDYNQSAFCNNICYAMLRSWVVIVIGDWKKNQGNVNVAYEYGIATAMGCEIVPIWIKDDDDKLPFDISGLHAILIPTNFMSNSRAKDEFKVRFIETFKERRARLDSLALKKDISACQKEQMNSMINDFWDTLDQSKRKTIVYCLSELAKKDYRIYSQDEFVSWVMDVIKSYALSFEPKYQSEYRTKKYELDLRYLDLLLTTVTYNINNPNTPIRTKREFFSILAYLVESNHIASQIRKYASDCLFIIMQYIGDRKLLIPIWKVIEDTRVDEGTYNQLNIPTNLRLCRDRNLELEISIAPVLELLFGLKEATDPIIKKRYTDIDNVFHKG